MAERTAKTSQAAIRVGVSACLLGRPTRYDGRHKRDRFLIETLGARFELVPVCPEVGIGLPVPRPRIRLEQRGGEVRLVMPETGRDLTEKMHAFASVRADTLGEAGVCGMVLKAKSPSCGLRVRTFWADGEPAAWARGRFAEMLAETSPNLPLLEDDALHAPELREAWIARVLAYHQRL